jgi:CRISPR-associated endonuclease/helicase Cas3
MEPWGKAREGRYHHLAHHCADVAACFEALSITPVIQQRLESAAQRPLSTNDISRLTVLAFLHDVGKLHPGFQAKAWTEHYPKLPRTGHLGAGEALFTFRDTEHLFTGLELEHVCAWGLEIGLLKSVLSHHGRPFDSDLLAAKHWATLPNGYNPQLSAIQFGRTMRAWFAPAFEGEGLPLPTTPRFQHLMCGLVTLADWLGSTEALFEYRAEFNPDYIHHARACAMQSLKRVGLDSEVRRNAVRGRSDFQTLTGFTAARPAQIAIGNASVDDQLLILEAETGSGKTEAALWRFGRLLAAGKVDSLYFALPTRAAAKQIHGRVNEAMQRVFGDSAPEAILAIPGYLKAGDAEGQALPGWQVRWDDEGGDDLKERDLASRWAAESNKKFLAAPVAVGTVDQAMLAALQVKHAHLRAAALSRSLLVIDEVHASDRYMVEVQRRLLDAHLALGGYAMLMSATLGSNARSRWLCRQRHPVGLEDLETAKRRPYPAVWSSSSKAPFAVAQDGRCKQVSMKLVEDWSAEAAADLAARAARAGAKVLVIRNTVHTAQDTFKAVQGRTNRSLIWQVGGEPALHHSRFAVEDRNLLDGEVERVVSPRADRRPEGGVIVIGTQTLEQSLDIDADVLITDLCPADVLLQRIGRLHRHDLPRPPGFELPECLVLSRKGGLDALAKPAFENGIGGFATSENVIGGVYTNLHACELTRRLICEHADWKIPDMNRLLVETATHEDMIEALCTEKGGAWTHYWHQIYGGELADANAAENVAIPFWIDFADMGRFPSDQEKIRTRLGAEGARIAFPKGTIGPFGQEISAITLPAHWSRGLDVPEAPVEVAQAGKGLHFRIESAEFSYGRSGLMKGNGDRATS